MQSFRQRAENAVVGSQMLQDIDCRMGEFGQIRFDLVFIQYRITRVALTNEDQAGMVIFAQKNHRPLPDFTIPVRIGQHEQEFTACSPCRVKDKVVPAALVRLAEFQRHFKLEPGERKSAFAVFQFPLGVV